MQVKEVLIKQKSILYPSGNIGDEFVMQHLNTLIGTRKLTPFFKKEERKKVFVCIEKLNSKRYINQYLRSINNCLNRGDFFVGYFETYTARKNRLKISKVPIVRNVFYFFDFLLKRVLPKIKYLNQIYFFLTQGKNQIFSKAEILGRLVCYGFEIKMVRNH